MAPSEEDISRLIGRVEQQIRMARLYSYENERGFNERYRRRVRDIIHDVVRDYFGRPIHDVIVRLRAYFGV